MSEFIDLRVAQGHTFRYQRSLLGSAQTQSATIDAQMMDQLTDQEGVHHVRVYLGEDELGRLTFVFVGADKDGNDLLPGLVLNQCELSPPMPASESPLNL